MEVAIKIAQRLIFQNLYAAQALNRYLFAKKQQIMSTRNALLKIHAVE